MKQLEDSSAESIAQFFVERYRLAERGGTLYRYTGHHWEAQDDTEHLHKLLYDLNNLGLFTIKKDKETGEDVYTPIKVPANKWVYIIKNVRAACHSTLEDVNAVACNNVVLEIPKNSKQVVLREIDPEFHVTAYLPLVYDIEATCPKFLKLLDRMFSADSKEDAAKKKDLIQEFYGACVFGLASRFQRCLIMHGPGGNGKSTLQQIMRHLVFTSSNCCSISPMRWHEEFGAISLRDKRLNSVDELPQSGRLLAGDVFKSIVGGAEIEARKLFQNWSKFTPTCGHVFSTNHFPRVTDNSLGFWRRILLISCNTPVESGVSTDEIIDDLREEASGILKWCVQGVERLLKNTAYTVPDSHFKEIEEWKLGTEPIRQFIKETTLQGPSYKVRSRTLWEAYNRWARQTRHFGLSESTFAERMKEIGIRKEEGKNYNFYRFGLLEDDQWANNKEEEINENSTS